MKVLLLGVTGRVGSRLLPALRRHNHEVVAYLRDRSKLSSEAQSHISSIVEGSGTDSSKILSAVLEHNCDAIVNAAGLAPALKRTTEFPAVFAAIVKAATDVRSQRSAPLRCWFLSGWSLLDIPGTKSKIISYMPIYPDHITNYTTISSIPRETLSWSLFCASNMPPRSEEVSFSNTITTKKLDSSADTPPRWSTSLAWVPLLGSYLNIMAQAQSYYTPLEDCAEFIANDLDQGLDSEFVCKRVGVKAAA